MGEPASRLRRWREHIGATSRGTRRRLRGHDLALAAAGLTFYAAIAIVPLLLVAWWLAAGLLGSETVTRLSLRLADYAPETLGLAEALAALGDVGPRLHPVGLLAALAAATTYGDGLVRAFDRFEGSERRAKSLRGRALGLLFVAALVPAVLLQLGAIAAVPDLLPIDDYPVLRFYVAFWVGWIVAGGLMAVCFQVFSAQRIAGAALWWGAAGTGSFLAGMTLGWVVVLEFGVDVGLAFGGSTLVGTLVLSAVYLYLMQFVVLTGFAATLALDDLRRA